MKKLILLLVLFITGLVAKSQTYIADSMVYYSSAYNPNPDTTLSEEIRIVLERGTVTISKHNARFNAIITDTLPEQVVSYGAVDRIFKIRRYTTLNHSDTGYVLLMIMTYFNGRLVALGLLHNEQLFIYHIVNELINGQAWIRKRME